MIDKPKKTDVKISSVAKKKVSQIIQQHLIQEIPKEFEIYDGVPFGIKYYNISNEPCWTVLISHQISGVGSSRMICVSEKKPGRLFMTD